MKQFDLKAYMDVTPEIEEAVRTGKPVVALESTILSHGMPYPENLSFAREVEKIIREQGAIPATMAIIDGRLKCGLTEDELVRMCEAKGVLKVSRRDLPIVVAQKLTGATTVATTMILANMAGIHVFATGGIGGLYEHSTNFPSLTADACRIAREHGVELENMDYVQIHPTSLYTGRPGRAFLISESCRGEARCARQALH